MNPYNEFKPLNFFDLTASQVGISSIDWIYVDNEDENQAKHLMAKHRFDILPVKSNDNIFRKYFSTRKWNDYSNLNLNTISVDDCIYYRMSFFDLIKKFSITEKNFFLLWDECEVIGLISKVNLNSYQVYRYLYQVISDLEISISTFLAKTFTQDEILNILENSDDKHQIEIVKKFRSRVLLGDDNNIFEDLYLQTLGIILKKGANKLPNDKKELVSYSKSFASNGNFNKIRNIIMHPVKSLVNDKNDITSIDELLSESRKIKKIINKN